MQQQRKRLQFLGNSSAILLLCAALMVATVASVPTSVLVQNSEMASNMNAINNNNNMNRNNNNNLMMTKVKRSSNDAKEGMLNGVSSNSAVGSSSAAGLDKKSSPEIVPASFNAPPPRASSSGPAEGNGGISLPTNGEIINSAIAAGLTAAAVEAAAAANQRELDRQQQQYIGDDLYGSRADETPTLLHKRGISTQQYLYGPGAAMGGGYGGSYASNSDFYNNPYLNSVSSMSLPQGGGASAVPNGIWTDEIDPSVVYTDLQDLDDYAPAPRAASSYRNKAYDNLQSLLNSEAYLEPVVLPSLQYSSPSRYYGAVDADRNKRSNLNNFNKFADMRLKRDTKLTPADMLALVALVEAGERARKDTDTDTGYMYPAEAYNNPKNYYPSAAASYDYPTAVDENDNGAWNMEPAVVDYYGVPVNMETMPKYELAREHKYSSGSGNRFTGKRFMVAKKKRSLGKFLNEPVAKPSIVFNSNGEKYF